MNKNKRIFLVLVTVFFLYQCQSTLASGWERVGGIQLLYGVHPSDAGAYNWPWSGDNGDGTTTYAGYTFDKYGGPRYGILYVDNSIGSNDAYISQTFSVEMREGRASFDQYLSHALPSGGATGIWIEVVYSTGDVDRIEQTSNGSWQSFYFTTTNDGPGTSTEYSVRIGVLKNPAVTTGVRSVIIDKALLDPDTTSSPGLDNWTFDTDDHSSPVTITKNTSWECFGGMNLSYEPHPPPTPPGPYEWTWSGDNGDGTTTYGAYTFDKYGGMHYGKLSVDNSIGSYDAYIEQSVTLPPGTWTGLVGQQFLNWANPEGGTTDVWVKLIYNSGAETDSYQATAISNWDTTYWWVDPAVNATDITIRIGLVKDPLVTTGTRSLYVEDALLWDFAISPHSNWENWNFELESLDNAYVDEVGPTSDTYSIVLNAGAPSSGTVDITVDPDDQVEVNNAGAGIPVIIQFDSGNWDTAQTITVTAIDDDIFEDYIHTSFITHTAAASDPDYNDVFIQPMIVQVTDNRRCDDMNLPFSMANTDLIDEEELAVVSEHWLEPNALGRSEPIINLETFGQMAQDWLEPDIQQLWFDDALPFRGMYAAQYGGGAYGWIWDVYFSDTAQWNSNLTTYKNDGYNTMVYWAGSELTTGVQTYLTLDDFPEAKEISDATVATNRADLQWLLARGKELRMNNIIYSYAIWWSEAFGNYHDLNKWMPVDEVTVSWYHNAYPPNYNLGVYTPLTAAYTASVYSEFIQTYEDMDGFYGVIGEPVPNLRRGEFYQEGIAPGLICGSNQRGNKPLYIAHNWQMNLEDYKNKVANSGAYDNLWLAHHAWNGEQICDTKPNPEIINYANETGLHVVVTLYPANTQVWPFNSPKLAAEIIAEMKKIPHIKGFVYFEMAGRLSSPLFRKALGYYGGNSEAYSDEPWLDILEAQFGDRTAAQYILNAWNSSGYILPEECALIYYPYDVPSDSEKELRISYKLLASTGWGAAAVSPNRDMVSIHDYAAIIASNPSHDFGSTVTPPQQMVLIKELGQEAFDEATAAMPYVTTNYSQAQDILSWMEGFKLMTAYYELKVNAAIDALIYKDGGGSSYKTQAESLAQQAYDAYITASNHLIAECRPIFQAQYGIDLKMFGDPNTLEDMQVQELNDKNNIGSIMGAW